MRNSAIPFLIHCHKYLELCFCVEIQSAACLFCSSLLLLYHVFVVRILLSETSDKIMCRTMNQQVSKSSLNTNCGQAVMSSRLPRMYSPPPRVVLRVRDKSPGLFLYPQHHLCSVMCAAWHRRSTTVLLRWVERFGSRPWKMSGSGIGMMSVLQQSMEQDHHHLSEESLRLSI